MSLPFRGPGIRRASWRVRYAVGAALFGLALAGRFSLDGILPPSGFPFLTFFPVVLMATFLVGVGPGLMVAGASILGAWYFFIPPRGALLEISGPDTIALAVFGGVQLVNCLIVHLLNLSHDRVLRARQLLVASEGRLRNVLDQMFVAAGVLDLDGTLREANGALLETCKVDRVHATGRRLWEIDGWHTDPARALMVRGAIARAAQGETVRFDIDLGAAGGPANTLDFQVAPLRGPQGRVKSLVVCGVDVTARVLALADLEKSRAEALSAALNAERERRVLDATFNAVPAGIIVADATGRLVRMSRATERIWGIAPYSEDVSGYGEWKGWWAGDSPRAGQRIQPHEWGLARSLKGEHCTDIVEVEPFGREGERLVTLLSSAPVLDPNGKVAGGVVVQIDITDRIQAEKALREADRQKDTFLATLSHELRNPLAPIRAAAHIINLSATGDERVRNAAAVIERQSAQLKRLVDDLLDVSRLKFGSLQLRLEAVDLRRVVESALETSRPLVDAAGHELSVRMPTQPLMVRADPTRVAQCISNLVNNASKFTPAHGRISVDVETREGGWVSVLVRDNGYGISPGMLGKIFDLFAQERRSGMGGNKGLGIGLALTRELVRMHGGRVGVRSEGEGRGAEFEILLPVLPKTPEAPADATLPPPRAAPAPACDVLVVDDNADAVQTLRMLLQIHGLNVMSAGDGESALALARAHRPRAIVLDIGLPDMTGYEVARRLRDDPGWKERPLLVALTGWGQAQDRERATQAGFDCHLTKPADPDALVALLRQRLARPGVATAEGAG